MIPVSTACERSIKHMQGMARSVLQGLPPVHGADRFVVVEGFRVRIA